MRSKVILEKQALNYLGDQRYRMSGEATLSAESSQLTLDLTRLMGGQAVPLDAIDVQRDAAMQFVPRTKSSMRYIVMTAVFDEGGRVLLIQEAGASCQGTWYLPGGRLEPGENIVDGAKREIVEEAGLQCELSSLFSLNYPMGNSMILCFYGTITGGRLKTLEQRDAESLQAAFYDVNTVLNNEVCLRKKDILPVIRSGLEYRSWLASPPSSSLVAVHPPVLPVVCGHRHMVHRPVLVAEHADQAGLCVLVGRGGGTPHLITAAIAPNDDSLHTSLQAITTEVLDWQTASLKTRLCGVLGVEHCGTGQGQDGMVLTTLVSLDLSSSSAGEGTVLPPVRDEGLYAWVAVRDEPHLTALRHALSGSIVKLI